MLPLSVAVGNEDQAMTAPMVQQMMDILKKKKDDHEVIIMPGATHGFAVRTDPDDPLQMEYADKAEVQAISSRDGFKGILAKIAFRVGNTLLLRQWRCYLAGFSWGLMYITTLITSSSTSILSSAQMRHETLTNYLKLIGATMNYTKISSRSCRGQDGSTWGTT